MGIFNFFRRKKKDNRIGMPTCLDKDLQADLVNNKIISAIKLRDSGREDEAEILLRQIVEEQVEHVQAWFILAEHFMYTDELGRALYCYEKVIKYQPANQSARDQINQLNAEVRKRPDYLWEYNRERGLI